MVYPYPQKSLGTIPLFTDPIGNNLQNLFQRPLKGRFYHAFFSHMPVMRKRFYLPVRRIVPTNDQLTLFILPMIGVFPLFEIKNSLSEIEF